MRIAIVGSGVVGHATGMGLASQGHDVVYCDKSPERRSELVANGHPVVATVADVRECDVYVVCVPTPANHEGYDLGALRAACHDLAHVLTPGNRVTVVVRSTLLPGTMRDVVLPILETESRLRVGEGFGLCYNPEFLRAASALEDLTHPPLTVCGEFDEESADLVASLHEPFGAPLLRTTPENAEAIKCFSNALNAMKISFFNLLFLAGRRAGLEPEVVAGGIVTAATCVRFPDYGTPGGRAYGGACLPKDLCACIRFLEAQGLDPSLLAAVENVNSDMHERASLMSGLGF